MRFMLLLGQLSHGRDEAGAPITYTPGQIIESDIDLVKRHGAQKFRRLDGETEEERAARTDPTMPAEDQSAQAPAGQVSTGHQVTTSTPQGTPVSGAATPDQVQQLQQRALATEAGEQLTAERRAQQQGQDYRPPGKSRLEQPMPQEEGPEAKEEQGQAKGQQEQQAKGGTPGRQARQEAEAKEAAEAGQQETQETQGEGQEASQEEPGQEEQPPPPPPAGRQVQAAGGRAKAPDFESMSNNQLAAHAAQRGINLRGAKKREDIVKILRQHQ